MDRRVPQSACAACPEARLTDTRRVCDLSPLELLEAAFTDLAQLGLTHGVWDVEIRLEQGRVRRVVPEPAGPKMPRAAIGRRQLGELGSAA